MDAVTNFIVRLSKLEVTHIKITDATPDSFMMAVESKLTVTGPVSSEIAAMTVDLVGPGGAFGKLGLPVIKTSFWGVKLQNGKTTVRSLGKSSEIMYNKDCPIKGMQGPRTTIKKTEVKGGAFENTMITTNPSLLELDLGTVKQEIRTADGTVVSTQQGKLYLMKVETTSTMEGKPMGKVSSAEATLVANGVLEDNWHKETIQAFEVSIVFLKELVSLLS